MFLLVICIWGVTLPIQARSHFEFKSPEKKIADITVSGTVTDLQGEPLIGVNVLVKGTNKGTSTGIDGHFSLAEVEEDATTIYFFM